MEALANEGGVAVETVYATFGSKRSVLARLVDVAVGGDDAPIPILERQKPQQVRSEPDQRQQIRLFARDMTEIMERVGPLFGVMRAAAISEPEIAALLQRLLKTRWENIGVFVQWLEQNGPLRAGLSGEEATDITWTTSSGEVHQLLRKDRDWTRERYEQWLTETLSVLLLPPEATPR
jgi:AcrR family transcriptional regulator